MGETDVGLTPLPDGWVWTTVRSVIEKVPLGKKKLKQKNYEPVGKLPVIDQGLSFIGGYTNHEELKVECQLPIVVFGDHTKVFKYVDFDFVAGADGIKVIRPQEMYYPKLFYYFARAISLPEKGYARHFQFLEKAPIPLPPLPEQHRIVAKIEELFTKLDAGINELHKAQSQLKQYRQSVLKAAFEGKLTEAWQAEYQGKIEPASILLERILKERREKWEAEQLKQMQAKGKMPKDDKWKVKYKEPVAPDTGDLPELPNGWRWTTVGSIGLVASGQTPKGINDLDLDGEIPFYKISDMNKLGNERFMRASEIALDHDETERLGIHVREQGTVIFPKRGGAIATNKKRILSCPSAYDLNIMGVLPYIVPTDFFYQWLLSIDLAALSDGSNVPQLNHKDIDPLPFPLPPLPEQQAIVSEVESRLSVTDEVEKTIAVELKRAEQLRQSILKKAFSGELAPQDPNDEPASVLLERIKAEKSQHIQGQLRLKLA